MREETIEKEIDLNKRYNFPSPIRIISYKNMYLVISVLTAKWIVLKNKEQLYFFDLLNNALIGQAIEAFNGSDDDWNNVLVQIEAKKIIETNIKKSSEGKRKLHFYLTNFCNIRCPHCYMFAGKKSKRELSFDEIISTLRNYKKNGGEQVTFSGGELTTRKDFCEIIEYASKLNLEILLLTNGILWTDEQIRRIAPLIYSVQISIDGYNEDVNAKVRGAGNFSRALHTVERFLFAGAKTEIAITPYFDSMLKENFLEYSFFAKKLLKKYENYDLNIRFSSDLIDGRNVKLSAKEKLEYHNIAEKIMSNFYGVDAHIFPFISVNKENIIHDNCSFGELAISCEGDIFFCSRIPSMQSNINVRTHTFEEIMKLSNKAADLSKITNLAPCNNCELMYICGGDCRIEYFPEFSTLNVEELEKVSIQPRKCTKEYKNHFYEMMIKTNEDLFV